MTFDLPEELVSLRNLARQFAESEVKPHARSWDAQQKMPLSFIKSMGETGFLGVLIPEQYGGSGLGYLGNAVVMEEFGRYDGGIGFLLAGNMGLCATHILVGGSDAQKRHYLPKLATGEWLGCWGLTEPGSGSDAAAMTTRATRDGAGWRINGQKQFITNGTFADVCVLMAKTEPDKGAKGISAFVFPTTTPGYTRVSTEDKLGMRSSDTALLAMDNMYLGPECLLGEVHLGFIDALKVLERGRVGIGALGVGLARAALEDSIAYAKTRQTFGKPLAEHQAIQFMLADMATHVEAARLLVHDAASALDRGEDSRLKGSIAKVFATEIAMKATLDAVQIHGGAGCTKDLAVERYMRDIKVCEIGEGTSQVQRMLIARELLKAAAA